jgi:hypothetical protein
MTEIDVHKLLAQSGQIAIVWCIEDVKEVRPDLTDDQAWEVLQLVERSHDANFGVSWETLDSAAHSLFGDAAKKKQRR